jgi:hypothetical protein
METTELPTDAFDDVTPLGDENTSELQQSLAQFRDPGADDDDGDAVESEEGGGDSALYV